MLTYELVSFNINVKMPLELGPFNLTLTQKKSDITTVTSKVLETLSHDYEISFNESGSYEFTISESGYGSSSTAHIEVVDGKLFWVWVKIFKDIMLKNRYLNKVLI